MSDQNLFRFYIKRNRLEASSELDKAEWRPRKPNMENGKGLSGTGYDFGFDFYLVEFYFLAKLGLLSYYFCYCIYCSSIFIHKKDMT